MGIAHVSVYKIMHVHPMSVLVKCRGMKNIHVCVHIGGALHVWVCKHMSSYMGTQGGVFMALGMCAVHRCVYLRAGTLISDRMDVTLEVAPWCWLDVRGRAGPWLSEAPAPTSH